MAEPSPSDKDKGQAKPTLLAVGRDARGGTGPAPGAPAERGAGARPKRSRTGLWLLALVAAIATVAALVQTERLQDAAARAESLSEQVLGLEAQLAAAHAQIATYEMQRDQIRDAVSDLSQRVLALGELVGGEEAPPPEEAP